MAIEDRQGGGDGGLTPRPAVSCPLCGGPNGCMPAQTGNFDAPCWCRDVRFDAALLASVPLEQRGIACICRRCVEAARDPAT